AATVKVAQPSGEDGTYRWRDRFGRQKGVEKANGEKGREARLEKGPPRGHDSSLCSISHSLRQGLSLLMVSCRLPSRLFFGTPEATRSAPMRREPRAPNGASSLGESSTTHCRSCRA